MDTRTLVLALMLPPGGPILSILFGLILALGWPRAGRLIIVGSALALYLFSIPAVSDALVSTVGSTRAADMTAARRAHAIVVLAAGLSGDSTELTGVTLGPLTLERLRYAVRLAKELHLPVAVSGGAGPVGLTEADLMRNALVDEYGLHPRWVENRSANTRQNAAFTAPRLRQDSVSSVLLVTHPFDVRRARLAFEAEGIAVISAPAQVPPASDFSLRDFVPSVWALLVSHYCVYEVLALTRDALR